LVCDETLKRPQKTYLIILFNEGVQLGYRSNIKKVARKKKFFFKSWNNSWDILEFKVAKMEQELLKAWKELKILYGLPSENDKLGTICLLSSDVNDHEYMYLSKYIFDLTKYGEDTNSLKIKRLENLAWYMTLPSITRKNYT
jgi:hypothetical protein